MASAALKERSDAELVQAIRDGDQASESEIFRRHRQRVVLWVTSRTGDPFAEDHYHDAFVKVLVPAIHKQKIRDEARVEAFLRTITLRLSLRSRKTKEVHFSPDVQWENLIAASDENEWRSKQEEFALEEVALLRRVLAEDCSDDERRLHMRYWVEGKELKELAKEEGIREAALRKRHSRMLLRIRQGMADRLWTLVSRRIGPEETPPTDILAKLDDLTLLSGSEMKSIQIRYVGRRPWDIVARRESCSEREAAEKMLALLRRLRRDI